MADSSWNGPERRLRRRQWGGDRRADPIAGAGATVSEGQLVAGRLAVVVTLLAWATFGAHWLSQQFISPHDATTRSRVEAVAFFLVVTLLMASALAYLICRLGYLTRSRQHRRVAHATLDEFYGRTLPTLTTLIPSYKEDARVVRNTLLSVALQEYPDIGVVLLLDDPPHPATRRERASLQVMRELPQQVTELLDPPAAHFAAALARFEAVDSADAPAMELLAGHYDHAVAWLTGLADETGVADHTDRFFVDHVVLRLAADCTLTAAALRSAVADGVILTSTRMIELYRRLAWTFQARLSSFERKQYVSLSHDANKAMNLNSYLGLMGGSYVDLQTVAGRVLLPSPAGTSDFEVVDADYVMTLDADSIVLPEYAARLVYLLEQSEHAGVAVVQTPYSSYPGADTRLERIAGASTDLQFIAHQGMTRYAATFWVGANAILRKRALDEICERTFAGNWEIRRYVQDRTLIEDTESTIDLRIHGWSLVNYPERLAYSATPPDFGSLCIQRRRWANGGILILSKLRRQRKVMRVRGAPMSFSELFLRTNYLASIAWCSVSLLLLLAYPFRSQLTTPLLGLIALPYFLAQASDLKACGYRRLDILRIYGFNMVLLPVNLGGIANSLLQAVTGEKSQFGRTPKVCDRTIPNMSFIVAPYLVVVLAAASFVRYYDQHRWVNVGYAAANAVLTLYAIVAFVGLRRSAVDLTVQLWARLHPQVRRLPPAELKPAAIMAGLPVVDWAAILDFTGGDLRRRPLPAPTAEPAPGHRPALGDSRIIDAPVDPGLAGRRPAGKAKR